MMLTERQRRVFERISDVRGKWVRWERKWFLGDHKDAEPVTREINALDRKGLIDLWSSGLSKAPQIAITEAGRKHQKEMEEQ